MSTARQLRLPFCDGEWLVAAIFRSRALRYRSIGGVWSKQIDFLRKKRAFLATELFYSQRAIRGVFVTMIKLLPFSGFSLSLHCLFSHLASISRSVSLGYDSINKHCLKTHIPCRDCAAWRCRCFWTGTEHLLWLPESRAVWEREAWGKGTGKSINIEEVQHACGRSVMFSPG